jgi:peptidoglycan/LPS O-acetylase OafA/YrhL
VNRWPALDGVRGVAVLLVLAGHADLVAGDRFQFEAFRGGHLGVDIFFVLSGCLITLLLLDEHGESGHIRISHFYARRALRLLPALVCAIVLVGVLTATVTHAAGGRSFPVTVALVIGYVANWAQAHDLGYLGWLGHAWTLSIEEQFYLLWPLVLSLLLRRRVRTPQLLLGLSAAIIGCMVYRILGVGLSRFPNIEFQTPARADALLVGCAAGILLTRRSAHPLVRWTASAPAGIAACVAIGGIVWMSQLTRRTATLLIDGGYTVLALAVAVLLAHCVLEPGPVGIVRRALSTRPLREIGRVSYGVYLYHFPIFLAVHESRLSRNHAVEIVASLALTASAAAASFIVLERPMLRLKRRFERPGERLTDAQATLAVTGKTVA